MRFAAALVLASLFAAGCSTPAEDSDQAPLSADSYRLSVANVPATPVAANASFSFDLMVEGDGGQASDHIGAHFGNRTTSTPSTTVYATTCQHQAASLPGDFQVTCKAPATPGVYFLRGHTRIITAENVTHQWWSAETTFTVA